MNDGTGPKARSERNFPADDRSERDGVARRSRRYSDVSDLSESRRLRSALDRVAELLEDGAIDEAYALAVAAAEPPRVDRAVCQTCGLRFEWPGELDHHVRFVHASGEGRRAA